MFLLPPGPQTPPDLFSCLKNRPLFLFGKQLALSLAFLSNTTLALRPVIGPSITFKPLSGLNIVPLLMLAKQTISVYLPLSSLLMTSFFSAQKIPILFIFLLNAVIKPFLLLTTQSTSFIPPLDLALESLTQGEN